MTTHELARKLLEMPDVPATALAYSDRTVEICEDDLRLSNQTFFDETETKTSTKTHLILG